MLRTCLTLLAVALLAGCAGPGPQPYGGGTVEAGAAGGPASRMARCMQYASKDTCEDQVWGGP